MYQFVMKSLKGLVSLRARRRLHTAVSGVVEAMEDRRLLTTCLPTPSGDGVGGVLESGGFVYVAAHAIGGGTSELRIVRYAASGALDTTWGDGGQVAVPGFNGQVQAMISGGPGSLLVAGEIINGSNSDFGVARISIGGEGLDPSFGTGGIRSVDIGGSDVAFGLTRDGSGNIILVGETLQSGVADVAVVKMNSTGLLNGVFGAGGIATWDSGPGQDDRGNDVVTDFLGNVYVVGTQDYVNFDTQAVVVGFDVGGGPLSGFGSGGVVEIDYIFPDDFNNPVSFVDTGVAIEIVGGRLMVAGTADSSSRFWDGFGFEPAPKGLAMLAAVSLSTGALDGTFGTGGILVRSIDPAHQGDPDNANVDAEVNDMVLSGGNLYLAVTQRDRNNPASTDIGVMRFDSNGVHQQTSVKLNAAGEETADAVAVDSLGRALVAGESFNAGFDAATARFTLSGVDAAWNTTGIVVQDLGFAGGGGPEAVTATISPVSGSFLEGGLISLSGSGSLATCSGTTPVSGSNLSWSVSNGVTTVASGSGATFAFTPADNGTYTVTLTAVDGALSDTDTVMLSVGNVNPTAILAGPGTAVRNQPVSVSAAVQDAGTADTHTVAWVVLKDGNSFDSGSGLVANFTPTDAGSYQVIYTVSDDDGGVATPAPTHTVTVSATSFVGGVLSVGGAPVTASRVALRSGLLGGLLLTLDGINSSYAGVNTVVVYGGSGNDHFSADGLSVNVVFLGGAGDDKLKGSAGDDVLVGGDDDDMIGGGDGQDLLIGGNGADKIHGNSDDDIIIGGSTAYDGDVASLRLISDTWNSAASFEDRVTAIANPSFSAKLVPGVTVFDDGVVDILHGNGDRDWFFASAEDKTDGDPVLDFLGNLDLLSPI